MLEDIDDYFLKADVARFTIYVGIIVKNVQKINSVLIYDYNFCVLE